MKPPLVVTKDKSPSPKDKLRGGSGDKVQGGDKHRRIPLAGLGLNGQQDLLNLDTTPVTTVRQHDIGEVDSLADYFGEAQGLVEGTFLDTMPIGSTVKLALSGGVKVAAVLGVSLDAGVSVKKTAHGVTLEAATGLFVGLDLGGGAEEVVEALVKAGVFGNYTVTASADSVAEAWTLLTLGLEASLRGKGRWGEWLAERLWVFGDSYEERLARALAKMDALPEYDETRYNEDKAYKAQIDEAKADADTITILTEVGLKSSLSLKLGALFGVSPSGSGSLQQTTTMSKTVSEYKGSQYRNLLPYGEEYDEQGNIKEEFQDRTEEKLLVTSTSSEVQATSLSVSVGPIKVALSEVITDGKSAYVIKLSGSLKNTTWLKSGLAFIVAAVNKATGERNKKKPGVKDLRLADHLPTAAIEEALAQLAVHGVDTGATSSNVDVKLSGKDGKWTVSVSTDSKISVGTPTGGPVSGEIELSRGQSLLDKYPFSGPE